jgi:ribonuclease BN (tRNA processing enzyme)
MAINFTKINISLNLMYGPVNFYKLLGGLTLLKSIIVHTLGTGPIRSQGDRACSSSLIEFKSTKILVDVGAGTLIRLKQIKITPEQLNYIFITHFHPDHISDLIPIIFYLANLPSQFPSKALSIWGPPGFLNFIIEIGSAYGKWFEDFIGSLDLNELSQSNLELNEDEVTWRKVDHSPESIGYRFKLSGKIVAIPGDTSYCSGLLELCQNADLAVLECSFPDEASAGNHLYPDLVGRIAQQTKIKKLVLTHLYPETFSINPVSIIQQYFRGHVEIGEDLKNYKS